MKTLLVAALLILSTLPCRSAGSTDADGRWWQQIPQAYRPVYVAGLLEGLMTGPSVLGYDETSSRVAREFGDSLENSFRGVDANEICRRLDQFYHDRRNLRIRVGPAVMMTSLKGRASAKQMEAALAEMRKKPR